MKICVQGLWHLGSVTAACLAYVGHDVVGLDDDLSNINNLKQGKAPLFEPGLDEMVKRNFNQGRLKFSNNVSDSIKKSDIIFICVGTPTNKKTNAADLKYVFQVAHKIKFNLNKYKIIVNKSTVPVTTGDKIESILKKNKFKSNYDVVSNPEFLREGEAIRDFKYPDRIVIGSNNKKVFKKMQLLYEPLIKKGAKFFLYIKKRR